MAGGGAFTTGGACTCAPVPALGAGSGCSAAPECGLGSGWRPVPAAAGAALHHSAALIAAAKRVAAERLIEAGTGFISDTFLAEAQRVDGTPTEVP